MFIITLHIKPATLAANVFTYNVLYYTLQQVKPQRWRAAELITTLYVVIVVSYKHLLAYI